MLYYTWRNRGRVKKRIRRSEGAWVLIRPRSRPWIFYIAFAAFLGLLLNTHRQNTTATASRVATNNRPKPEDITRVVSGRVVDPEGKPVANATVHYDYWNAPNNTISGVIATAADGYFQFTSPGIAPDILFAINAPGLAYPSFRIPIGLSHFTIGTIVLRKAARVSGVVVDPAGRAVANAKIHSLRSLWNGGPNHGDSSRTPVTTTDAAGKFTIHDLAAEPHYIGVETNEFGDALFDVRLAEDVEEKVKIQLSTTGRVDGIVVNDTGDPVEGAIVGTLFQRAIPPWRLFPKTDDQGKFSLYLIYPMGDRQFKEPMKVYAQKGVYGAMSVEWEEFKKTRKITIPSAPQILYIRTSFPWTEVPPGVTIQNVESWERKITEGKTTFELRPIREVVEMDRNYAIIKFSYEPNWIFPERESPIEYEDFKISLTLSDGSIFETDIIKKTPAPSINLPEFVARRVQPSAIQQRTFTFFIEDQKGDRIAGMPTYCDYSVNNHVSITFETVSDQNGQCILFGVAQSEVDLWGASRDLVLERFRFIYDSNRSNPIPVFVAKRGSRIFGTVTINGKKPERPVFIEHAVWGDSHFIATDNNGVFRSDALFPGKLYVAALSEVVGAVGNVITGPRPGSVELTLADGEEKELSFDIKVPEGKR
ncbi:MAG: hypothetical protein ACKVS6_09485 [Planctomycetota bacterium]